jgi:ribonuclease VapC
LATEGLGHLKKSADSERAQSANLPTTFSTTSASRLVSAVSYVEAAVVIYGSRNPIASRRFDDLFREARLVVEPVTEAQARIAREAYRDFGKGSRHPAGLNLGDCFAHALAKPIGEPILFKGDDFKHTDLSPVLT